MRSKIMAFAACIAILTLSACSPQAREARYLEKGKQALQKRNYSVAVIEFKNAAKAMPRDAEPYYQLGLVYLASNDFNTAASYLQKACELNPHLADAQLKLAALMSTSRNKSVIEEAQKRTEDVLKLLPDDADALNVLAITELKLGKPESAEAHLEEALRKSPGNLRSSIALAQTMLARKDVAGAEQALKQAVAQAPTSPEPRLYLGGFYLALGRTADAEQQFRNALAIDPKNGPALLALGGMEVRAGHLDQADQTYRAVSALPDKQYKPVHALFLFQSGKRDQAIAEFEKLFQSDPSDRNLRTMLVRAYLATNRVGDAEKILTAALKKNGLDTDALLQRARIYLASGKYAEAQVDLNRVLQFQSDSPEAHYLLSKLYQGRRQPAMQQRELGEALRLNPQLLSVRIELAQILIANGNAQAALQLMDQAPQNQKGTNPVILQRNWALLALGQAAEARKGIDQVLATGKVPEALLQDAALKLAQKDYTGARASAEADLTQNPQDVRALNVLLRTYAAQKQLALGVQKVREYAQQHLASAPVQIFLGQILAETGDRFGERKAFEAAAAAGPALAGPQLALAELDAADGKRDEARKRLTGVLSAQPGSVPGHLLMAQLDAAEGNNTAAVQQYRSVLDIDNNNIYALNGLAYELTEAGQSDDALKYAQQAKQLAPDDPAVNDTLGWTYFRRGLYTLALPYLQNATAKAGTAVREYHLAMAYLKSGDPARGRQTLQVALKMNPSLPEAQTARKMFGIGAN
jgi:tetratricopeptide (TPR) repeat protein